MNEHELYKYAKKCLEDGFDERLWRETSDFGELPKDEIERIWCLAEQEYEYDRRFEDD